MPLVARYIVVFSTVALLARVGETKGEEAPPAHIRNVGFKPAPSTPGEVQRISWANGTIVDPYAIQIGLPPSFTETVLQYCKDVGIDEIYRQVFVENKKLKAGTDRKLEVDGAEWYLQRPDNKWKSNMHWVNCNEERAHDRYLQLLGDAGFDVVLQGLGEFFDMDGIDIYSAGFIGVTHCSRGFQHSDFTGVNGKAFNVLIPLQLVDGSDPEFLVIKEDEEDEDGEGQVVRVHYEYGVALAVGDNTRHATAECDYRDKPKGSMRMAMSIYLADVNEDNVEAIISDYTDPFPPAEPEYLLGHQGRHWKKDDASVRLPSSTCPNPTSDPPTCDAGFTKIKAEEARSEEQPEETDEKVDSAQEEEEDDDDEEEDEDYEEDYGYVDDDEEDDEEELDDESQFDENEGEEGAGEYWANYSRDDLWRVLNCDEVFQSNRPVPTDATFRFLRQKYREIVGPEHSTISDEPASKNGGFQVPVVAGNTKKRGRAVYATKFIPKGSFVWNTKYTGRFPDAASYRRLMMSISPDLACEAMPWSYIQGIAKAQNGEDEEKVVELLSLDMDIGALINGGDLYSDDGSFDDLEPKNGKIPKAWRGYANVGCVPNDLPGGCTENYFALRDIYPKEELFVSYEGFALYADTWWHMGLYCTVCDVTPIELAS